jgi:hypothetical protein
MLFLSNHDGGGIRRVVGMAQGHYPLERDASRVMRLRASPRMPELVGKAAPFAVHRLVGSELSRARTLVREAIAK